MARMTIRDIARLAGVSVTTVSRALNNAPEINSQTRERVLQVCREQGYPLQPAGSEPSLQPDPRAGRHSAGALRPFSRLHRAAPGALRPGTGLPDHVVLRPVGGSETAALFDFW